MLTMKNVVKLSGPAVVLGLLAACASPSPATQPLVSGEVDLNEIICHEEQRTGSRFSKKVCKTRQEWEDEAAENQDAKRNIKRGAVTRDAQPVIGN